MRIFEKATTDHINEFENVWQMSMIERIKPLVEDRYDILFPDSLSDSGYWKLMAVAAWAEHMPNFDDIICRECLNIFWRETELATEKPSYFWESDDI